MGVTELKEEINEELHKIKMGEVNFDNSKILEDVIYISFYPVVKARAFLKNGTSLVVEIKEVSR